MPGLLDRDHYENNILDVQEEHERRLEDLERCIATEGQTGGFPPGDHTHNHDTDLTGVSGDDHHNQVHDLTGGDHSDSGLTTGHALRATGATAFAWQSMFDATVPTTITPDASAATGSVEHAARRDHIHGIACAAPATDLGVGVGNAEGSGDDFARAAHTHAITSTPDGENNVSTILQSNALGRLRIGALSAGTGVSAIPLRGLATSGEQLRLEYDTGGYASFTVADGGSTSIETATDDASGLLTLAPAGDIILNPTGDDVLPYLNYDINLGSIYKKYLTLHVAELWTDILIAEEKIGTIGGHILVAPTTKLTQDLSGTNLIDNGGFETAGAGGDDVFADWDEYKSDGNIQQGGYSFRGSYNGKLIAGASGDTQVRQEFSVTGGDGYTLSFWTTGDGTYEGHYAVYDVTNSAWITTKTATGVTSTSYSRILVNFAAPATCSTARLQLYGPTTSGGWARFDEVSIWHSTISVEHNQMVVDDIVVLDGQFTIEFARVVNGPFGSGPYEFRIRRDLDGTGANDWYAGDGVLNTQQTGDGFIDMYSVSGIGRYFTDDETGASWGPENHHLSLADGQAFLKVEGVDLWQYAGTDSGDTNFLLRLRDSSGYEAKGYIGAEGGGWTYGSNLLSNASFESFTGTADDGNDDDFDSWTESGTGSGDIIEAVTSPVHDGTYAVKVTRGNDGCNLWQGVSVTEDELYEIRFQTRGDGSVGGQYAVYDVTHSAWLIEQTATGVTGTDYTLVQVSVTAPAGCSTIRLYLVAPSSAGVCYFDYAYVREVTDCATTGVHIISAKDGTTQNWTYIDSNFEYNDSAYTLQVRGVQGGWGPTLVGNIRNSLTFNDWSEYFALGQLDGIYGYGTSTYGLGLGKYGDDHIVIDPSNGIRFRDSSDNVQAQLTGAVWTLGKVGASLSNVQITSGAVNLRTNTTKHIVLEADGDVFIGEDVTAAATTNLAIFTNAQTYNSESVAAGDFMLGDNTASKANVYWDKSAGQFLFRGGTTTQAYVDTDGAIAWASGVGKLDSSGAIITASGSFSVDRSFSFTDGSNVIGSLWANFSAGTNHYVELYAGPVTGRATYLTISAEGPGAAGTVSLVFDPANNYIGTPDADIYGDFDIIAGEGLAVGDATADPVSRHVEVYNSTPAKTIDLDGPNGDGRFAGGLYIGSVATAPVAGAIYFAERSSEPTKPAEGGAVIWMTDGGGVGDDGDVIIGVTAGGSSKYTIVHDHSEATAWT